MLALRSGARRLLVARRALCSVAPQPTARAASLTAQYDDLVRNGYLRQDPQQHTLAERLQELRVELASHTANTASYERMLRHWHAQMAEVHRLHEADVRRRHERIASLPRWRRAIVRMLSDPDVVSDGPLALAAATPSTPSTAADVDIHAIPRKETRMSAAEASCDGGGACGSSACSGSISGSATLASATRARGGDVNAAGETPSTAHTSGGGGHASHLDDLTDDERRHPFWAYIHI